MPTLVEAREQMKELSSQLSERTRTVSGGIVAIWWAVLVGDANPSTTYLAAALVPPVFLAGISVLIDFWQYLVGYQMTRAGCRAAEGTGKENFKYDAASLRYRLREFFFYSKQIAAAAAVVWFLIALLGLPSIVAYFDG